MNATAIIIRIFTRINKNTATFKLVKSKRYINMIIFFKSFYKFKFLKIKL